MDALGSELDKTAGEAAVIGETWLEIALEEDG
jgi:hypothetical protein